MIDFHEEINKFYNKHLRLDAEEVNVKEDLRTYRDRNIIRLKNGLKELGYNKPVRTPNQGSYAMHTLNQRHENNPDLDYDIDVATIFERDDLPEDPLKARQQVLAGVVEGGGNFRQPPEARTNAVTVWYQDGYHVDLPVFRTYTNWLGQEIVEHAGVNWTSRNPMDVTNWFNEKVRSLSPSKDEGAQVEENQLRRIVQFLKFFANSRPSWNLPGGLFISVLVVECYRSDFNRDDLSLYNTMVAISSRIGINNVEIYNPINGQLLTHKNKNKNQVREFRNKLQDAIDWLSPLFDADCDKQKAAKAWKLVYKHSYWQELIDQIEEAKAFGDQLIKGSYYNREIGIIETSSQRGNTMIPTHRYYGEDE